MEYLVSLKIKPDIDFFNQLIKRRASRREYNEVKNLLDNINDYELIPNIMTYGCLSMCCKSPKEILEILQDLEKLDIQPNIQIMGTLVRNSFQILKNPRLVLTLLKKMKEYGIEADEKMVIDLEKYSEKYRQLIVDFESGSGNKVPKIIQKEVKLGLPNWKAFCQYYEKWLKNSNIVLPESEWNQYKTKLDKPKQNHKYSKSSRRKKLSEFPPNFNQIQPY